VAGGGYFNRDGDDGSRSGILVPIRLTDALHSNETPHRDTHIFADSYIAPSKRNRPVMMYRGTDERRAVAVRHDS
jgi:hypothetical protein